MTSYIHQYLEGQCEQVWNDIQHLPVLDYEDTYQDVLDVVQETTARSAYNINLIVNRLKAVNYVFAQPSHIIALSKSKALSEIMDMELGVGPIPLTVKAWYKTFSYVNISGSHPSWYVCGDPFICGNLQSKKAVEDFYERLRPLKASGSLSEGEYEQEVARAADTMIEQSVKHGSKPLFNTRAFEFDSHLFGLYGYEDEEDGTIVGLSMWNDTALNQGEIRGYSEIVAPARTVDGVFRQPSKNIAPTFIGHLRKTFAWGGFPGFSVLSERLRPIEMLDYLREGLLPI